uniref:Plastid chloroplast ribosomal protein s6 n=1 Tax=Tetraselmis sp. GSL018 TaxID=582737 RepID=A0A061RX83_9CHLO|eukprot:CAMPEP_0177615464 /NCGR_PEP_ID=MMETSP0419_2-20121207/23456_1 /TAXON_ID=582737 /ORGANISM="Tetraselmis sp., Strain GSL018" /LENGTH=178 /DNA_ID=CAMNT_0019113097 /DNA_START=91 /DNA_END=627 /DNA_ORIENTATION=-
MNLSIASRSAVLTRSSFLDQSSSNRAGAFAAPPSPKTCFGGWSPSSSRVASRTSIVASRPRVLKQVVAAVKPEADTLPEGYVRYETMMVLRPNITNDERDRELAKFEVFLKNEEAIEISAMVRGRQRMAYPMQGHWEGIYVLYTYAAKRTTAQGVQQLLSNPDIESEGYLLRFMSFVV